MLNRENANYSFDFTSSALIEEQIDFESLVRMVIKIVNNMESLYFSKDVTKGFFNPIKVGEIKVSRLIVNRDKTKHHYWDNSDVKDIVTKDDAPRSQFDNIINNFIKNDMIDFVDKCLDPLVFVNKIGLIRDLPDCNDESEIRIRVLNLQLLKSIASKFGFIMENKINNMYEIHFASYCCEKLDRGSWVIGRGSNMFINIFQDIFNYNIKDWYSREKDGIMNKVLIPGKYKDL